MSRPAIVVLSLLAVLAVACGGSKPLSDPGNPHPASPASADPNRITAEGTLVVGTDVKPGTYKATVPDDSVGCYWARLKATDGSVDAIIANGVGEAGSKQTVTIKASDKAFETTGCGTWTKTG